MHLLIDIGNSTIVVAKAEADGSIGHTWRFKTQKDETLSFFRNELQIGINRWSTSSTDIESVIVSSVVPEINDKISQAIHDVIGLMPKFFSIEDAQKVINIDIESPSQLGKDRIADAIGAATLYGTPCIVIDMGTATTIGIVTADNTFTGGMIISGVKTSLKALSSRASQLPCINIEKPKNMIGRNTMECMQSGILYGTAAMIDGIIDRILPTLSPDAKIVATGGMSKQIIPYCTHNITIDEYLQFKGIFRSFLIG